MEEIYDKIVDSKRDGVPNPMWKVDVDDTKAYYRSTSVVGGGIMTEEQKKAREEELQSAIEEIQTYGSNEYFYNTHHQIKLQEEIILSLFKKV